MVITQRALVSCVLLNKQAKIAGSLLRHYPKAFWYAGSLAKLDKYSSVALSWQKGYLGGR